MLKHLPLILWISSDLLTGSFGLVLPVVPGRLSTMAAHTGQWFTTHDTTKQNPNHYSSLSQISSLFFFDPRLKTSGRTIWDLWVVMHMLDFPFHAGYLFLWSGLTFDSFSAGADCSSHFLNKSHAYTLVKFQEDGCHLNHNQDWEVPPTP